MTITVSDLSSIPQAAHHIIASMPDQKVFLFYGDMGAGKTTLIKGICAELGVTDPVSSPTFSIINEYFSPNGIIFHFDFYRLKNETEALDLGYEDYFYSGNYCFIEWPEKITNLLPHGACVIRIQTTDHSIRSITIEKAK